jgi:plastocyanin
MSGSHEWTPTELTVAVGGSITWFNDTTAPHTVSFTTAPDCGYVLGGKSVSVTFDTPGVFNFVCRIYPEYMSGVVTVQ